MSSTDLLLIERWIRGRDAEAFNEIVMRYSSLVYGTCRRVLRNHADAEDAAQECFLHLARAASPPRRSLGGWLHALATHRALDRLKSKARRRRREERFAASRKPAVEPDWDDVQEFVDEAIEALPEKLRSLIVAHFIEQRSQESIARELGLSRQTVTYRVGKGIEKVRRHLERRGVAVVLTSLSTLLSTRLVEAAPAGLKASLGRIALAGAGAARAGMASASGTATTLGALGGIGAMYKVGIAAGIALVLVLFLGFRLVVEEDFAPPPLAGGGDELAAATDASAGEGAGPATAAEPAPPLEPRAVSIDPDKVLRGRVVDMDGRAVAGAVVAAGVPDGEKLVEGAADAAGAFELVLPEAGTYLLCALEDGVGLGIESEAATGGEDRDVKLEPLGSVSGRVFDEETGEGLDDVAVSISYFGDYERRDPDRGRAFTWLDVGRSREPDRSPGGHYRFRNLLEARYLLKLESGGADYVVPGRFEQPFVELTLMKGEARTGFDFALERGGAVSGVVSGPDGAPLSGARASITSSKHSFSSPPRVTTNERGRYRFGGLAVGGSYAVVVDFEGLAQGYSETVTLSSASEVTGLDVHLGAGHTVFGRVVDEDGNGIAGVKFRLSLNLWRFGGGPGGDETVTDEEGSFRIEHVGPGEYGIVPRADGYESFLVRSLTMPADRDLHDQVFVLSRKAEGFVSGRVTDAGGRPLAGVRLLIGNDRRGPHVQEEAYTDETGLYRFDGIGKAETFRVSVYSQDYCYEEREQVSLNAENVDFTLERFASVIGAVIDDATGEVVPDFEVRATSYRNRPTGIPSEQWIPVHSESGEFILDAIEPPDSVIEVRASGYAPFVTQRIRIQPEETVELEVRLLRGATIRGRVVEAATGEPLPGVRVRVYGQSYFHALLLAERREAHTSEFQALATTDEEGRYEFAGLSPQKTLNLVAWRDGLGTQVLNGLLPPQEQEIRMHPEARIVAEVRRGPEPVENVAVTVSLNDRPIGGADYQNAVWSSARGIAEHTGLRPGRYRVLLQTRDRESLGELTREVRAGEVVELKIDLEELARRYARIRGSIAGLAEPVYVTLSPAAEPAKTIDSTFCRPEEGSFTLGGIPPGDYILRAQTQSKRETERKVTLRAGEELQLELALGE